jgi:hypothetical protein
MNRLLVVLSLGLMLAPAACQNAPTARLAADPNAPASGDSAAYLDKLSRGPAVTEAQAVRGMLMLLGDKPDLPFDQAVAALRQRKVVSAGWSFHADRPVTKGKVAYMVYQACAVPGGLTLTLAGPSQRYCLKELQYRGLMSPGMPYNPVTGMEYVSILARADELRQTGGVSRAMKREEGLE